MIPRQSAGILLFRRLPSAEGSADGSAAPFEVLLAHPGGPFFARRDEGHWTLPKGEPDGPAEDLLAVARREFAEEVGQPAPASEGDGTPPIELGTIVQKGGKVVHAWATAERHTPDLPRDRPRPMVRSRGCAPAPEADADPVRRPARGASRDRDRERDRRARHHRDP